MLVKREVKVIMGASLIVVAFVLAPIILARVRANREADLLNRKPRSATSRFRNQVRGTTHVNVFFGVPEADTPGNPIPSAAKPNLILRGKDAEQLVRALHFERDDSSTWGCWCGPYAGSIFGCTALEFSSNGKVLADLRVGTEYGGGLGARWYAPRYIGDSRLLPESRDFLEGKFGRRLSGF